MRATTPRLAAGFLLAAALTGLGLRTVTAESPTPTPTPTRSETPMSSTILVHVTHGPEHPTRAALAFAVASAALEEGHSVSIFLAGDAVQLIRDPVLDQLAGLGTGSLRGFYDAIVEAGGEFHLSGGSSAARGIGESDLEGKPARFAGPRELVALSLRHERMFTY